MRGVEVDDASVGHPVESSELRLPPAESGAKGETGAEPDAREAEETAQETGVDVASGP